ncbi:peptidylprolyl isomerase [Sunxiuqinia sp. A32]|uniref:peptidylprolyl isomerase n=1 Tax=Sunxiuqinia sp. A32 TaxID=3461496 RepID=UPI004045B8B5
MKKLAVLLIAFSSLYACNRASFPKVEISSSLGNIVVEIDTIHAPVTAGNFLSLVDRGVYLNSASSFYRVVRMDNQPQNKVKIEVIQGGLSRDEDVKEFPAIAHETTKQTGLKHLDGTISMARNEPSTANTEFFICVNDQPELDFGGKRNPDGQGFAAFGQVVEGMDVVLEIQQQPDDGQYLPKSVEIYSITRVK